MRCWRWRRTRSPATAPARRAGDRRRGAARALPRHPDHGGRRQGVRGEGRRRRDRPFVRRARQPAEQPGRAQGADAAHARLRRQPRRAAVGAGVRGRAGGGGDAVRVRRRHRDRVHRRAVRRRVARTCRSPTWRRARSWRPLVAAGKVPVVPGFIGGASGSKTTATRPARSARWRRWAAAAPT